MMQWWNNNTIRTFRERTQCIIDQYSRYKIDEVGMYINGRMTQGENIADNGGLKQAFRVNISNIDTNYFKLNKIQSSYRRPTANGFHCMAKSPRSPDSDSATTSCFSLTTRKFGADRCGRRTPSPRFGRRCTRPVSYASLVRSRIRATLRPPSVVRWALQ